MRVLFYGGPYHGKIRDVDVRRSPRVDVAKSSRLRAMAHADDLEEPRITIHSYNRTMIKRDDECAVVYIFSDRAYDWNKIGNMAARYKLLMKSWQFDLSVL